MNKKFIEPPSGARPSGVKICTVANLPAFETWPEAVAYSEKTGSLQIQLKWRCKHCEGWHFWTKESAPAGQSSGTARESPVPERIKEMAERDSMP